MSPEPLSRRRFIATSAAASLLAANALGQEAATTPPVRVGIVGVGRRGSGLLRLLLGFENVKVNAVCDIDAAKAAEAAAMVEAATGAPPAVYTNGDHDFENLCQRDDLDAVITATPWEWHVPVMVAAMRAGKYGGTEVPAAITVEDCWELVRTSEETGMPCMMLENVCYFENALAILRMVREGVFGDLVHAEAGYQHDVRFIQFEDSGELTWRGKVAAEKNGNLYPTHSIGPLAQWMNIHRGDRFDSLVSMSTASRGMKERAIEQFGPEHPLARRDYAQGDVNTTLIKTAKGLTVTLYYDVQSPRPYDLIFRVQGNKGIYMGTLDQIYLEGVSPKPDVYEAFAPYKEKYMHPLWRDLGPQAVASGGHGGADYITLHQFLKSVRNRTQTPQTVYDAAAWSAIFPLSIQSVAEGSQPVQFPDFTSGAWETTAPIEIHGA